MTALALAILRSTLGIFLLNAAVTKLLDFSDARATLATHVAIRGDGAARSATAAGATRSGAPTFLGGTRTPVRRGHAGAAVGRTAHVRTGGSFVMPIAAAAAITAGTAPASMGIRAAVAISCTRTARATAAAVTGSSVGAGSARRTMEVSLEQTVLTRTERLLSLAIDPYLIVAATTLVALVLGALAGSDLVVWVVFVGAVAGWSSAWSP
jgi:hypothetical protein